MKDSDNWLTCVVCGEEFQPQANKPGRINECFVCGERNEVDKLGGNLIWTHKHAPELEIKQIDQAKKFAKKQKRFGTSTLMCITQSREGAENPGMKVDTGTEDRAMYFSNLREKRHYKL